MRETTSAAGKNVGNYDRQAPPPTFRSDPYFSANKLYYSPSTVYTHTDDT